MSALSSLYVSAVLSNAIDIGLDCRFCAGAGSCVFLLVQKACALVLSQSRASTVVNLYLDAHAEPDLMLRRGR